MKKTLVSILLTILMSAGIIFSASSVSANTLPLGYSVAKNSNSGLIVVDYEDLEKAIIEYTYYSNGILMSELLEKDLNYVSSDDNTYTYTFSLPEDALSFKVWRVVTSDDTIKSLTGSFEYIYSPETAISEVETRIKTLYINDDLITKELVPISYGGIMSSSYVFNMHFNVEDALGNPVPIDRIHSLNVEYDVISTTLFFIKTINHYEKTIEATEERNMTVWPFITPASVQTYIKASIDSNYEWMVELASIPDADGLFPFNEVTLDQTTILTISYYYNDVFFEDIEVVDEPYDYQDIIEVIPGTTTELPGWLDLLKNIDQLARWMQIMFYVAIGIAVLLAVMLLIKLINTIKLILQGIWFVVKFIYNVFVLFFKTLFKVSKFIVIGIPKGIIDIIIFLVVPKEKRRERKTNASRYI